MTTKNLTYQDAELTLRLYEIRREATMRKSRDIVNGSFWPDSYADVQTVLHWNHPFNAAVRQTSSYWEMVYGMARNGIINADYLMENQGEGLVLFSKVQPYLAELRQDYGDTMYRNAEWITQNSETGRQALERIQARLVKFREMAQASKG